MRYKMIRKSYTLLIVLMILVVCQPITLAAEPVPTEARLCHDKEAGEFLASGYTEEGIYYEVYGTRSVTRAMESIFVTRTVVYEGTVQPDTTLYWKEYINGEAYAGTLALVKFDCSLGQTKAIYEGTLNKKIE